MCFLFISEQVFLWLSPCLLVILSHDIGFLRFRGSFMSYFIVTDNATFIAKVMLLAICNGITRKRLGWFVAYQASCVVPHKDPR